MRSEKVPQSRPSRKLGAGPYLFSGKSSLGLASCRAFRPAPRVLWRQAHLSLLQRASAVWALSPMINVHGLQWRVASVDPKTEVGTRA